ncbi:hypothetical protein NL529_32530, partial [Klebsiella pneumoniae]|nr:hypothetical protein [Klebsiella pneumoniae]
WPISGPIGMISPVLPSDARLFGRHTPVPHGLEHAAAPLQSALDVHGLPKSEPLAQLFEATALDVM